jgi:putative cardiolipin synthase
MRRLRVAIGLVTVIVLGLVGSRLLNPLPPLDDRVPSTAYTDTADTLLGRAIAPLAATHAGYSGVTALPSGRDAFAARMLFARAAERSIDVQYYIWRRDLTGTLLFEELRRAADRGVRVRVLLDDNNTSGLDDILAALDAHPQIELRLFNPFVIRGMRWLGYATDFSRLNRRMHNKSITIDSQVTIIGGRNVGDEYFDAVPEGDLVFADLDVLAVGPIVRDVAADFDRYWASGSSYPAEQFLPPADDAAQAALRAEAERVEQDPAAREYLDALHERPFMADLLAGRLGFEWTTVRMVSDDPAKGLGRALPQTLLPRQIVEAMGEPKHSLDLVSPYFVPTKAGVERITALAEEGVQVRILVNSLEATDVDVVHSGYIDHRKTLLRAGVKLYEMRLVGAPEPRERTGLLGSGASSLHAKTYAADRERIFIGSFNFDQRSMRLNTELGFVIESRALAGRLSAIFDDLVPQNAYEVRLSETGDLYWFERGRGAEIVRHDTEPGTTFVQRLFVRVLSWLPIESLL